MNGLALDLISEVKEWLEDLLKEEENEVVYGEILAYMEVLTIIREYLREDERAAYGLDFDVDQYYFGRMAKRKKGLENDSIQQTI